VPQFRQITKKFLECGPELAPGHVISPEIIFILAIDFFLVTDIFDAVAKIPLWENSEV
jgi:hypothetical protein